MFVGNLAGNQAAYVNIFLIIFAFIYIYNRTEYMRFSIPKRLQIIMSWTNPTLKEARDYYAFYKKQYSDAASKKINADKKLPQYISQRNALKPKLSGLTSQKLSIENRIRDLEAIIALLKDESGTLFKSIPSAIQNVNSSISKVDVAFRESIRVSEASAPALTARLQVPTVAADENNAAYALKRFEEERSKLQEQVEKLKTSINSLNDSITTLNRTISHWSNVQTESKKTMADSTYAIRHFTKKIMELGGSL